MSGEIILYNTEDGRTRLTLAVADGTVWLSQAEMAELFQATKQNISVHIRNILNEGELDAEATVKEYLTVQTEGERRVQRRITVYRLEMVLAVGYRVPSPRGSQFRRWATTVLQEYLLKGFALDDQRLKEPAGGFDYLDGSVAPLLRRDVSFLPYDAYKDSAVEWLGDVPSHWQCDPIRAVATCNDEVLTEATPPDYEIQYVEISDVEHGLGICGSSTVLFADAPSRARRRVRDGDVIVSTVRTYLKAIARVVRPPENLVASTGFAVVRPRSVHSGFLGYLIASEYVIAEVISRSVGVSYPAINASEVMRIKVPLPSFAEQNSIAAFLDRETAKIDALVKEQQRLIALLEEKRQAVISHAVTKGLDPSAPMKESGVEWLGEVPAHWQTKRLKQVLSNSKAGPFGSALTKDMYVADGYRVYGQEQVIPSDFTVGNYYISPTKFSELQQYSVAAGDILVSCVGTFGKVAIVPQDAEPGIINPRLIRLRCGTEVQAIFLGAVLRSYVVFEQFTCLSRGGTMDVINLGTLTEISLSVPPPDEQIAIVSFVDAVAMKVDALIREAATAISLLQERRAALISAAVTGKIDVRGLAFLEEAAA